VVGVWDLLWWFLWYLSVLVGEAVVLQGRGELLVTSVVMASAGSLGSPVALCSGVCLLETSVAL